ncbi:MAG: hypothetical protein IJN40_02495 [Clostridia bacterium]|nr:hypothetical protein [Clostridia bacterium]
MNALKWLWGYVKKYKLSLVVSLLLTVIFVVCAFATPIIPGLIVDEVIIGGNYSSLFFYCLALILFNLMRDIIIYVRHLINENVSQGVVKKNKDHALWKAPGA